MNYFTIPALKGVAPFFAQFPRQRLLAVAAGFLFSSFFLLAPRLHEAGEARFPAAAPRERFTADDSFAPQGSLPAVDPGPSSFIPGSASRDVFSRYKASFVDTLLRAVERFRAGSFRTASPDPSWLPLLERLVEDGF